jgi:hypothetical protein
MQPHILCMPILSQTDLSPSTRFRLLCSTDSVTSSWPPPSWDRHTLPIVFIKVERPDLRPHPDYQRSEYLYEHRANAC